MDASRECIVARPRNFSQVQNIMRYANKNGIFIFVRGAGTGYFGGEMPTREGIVLETTGLNHVLKLNEREGFVVCESGISVSDLNSYLREYGLWWPHNPGSRQWATVGGSLAALGVGTFSTRYGYASDSLLGLDLVTPTGDLVEINSTNSHDMTSYNLLDLICSSEGALGVIVRAKLKVFRLPAARKATLYLYRDIEDAVNTAYDIIESGSNPEALEIEDLERFSSEGLRPIVDLRSKMVQDLHLDQINAVLFVNHAGSKEHVRFASSHTSTIAKKSKGRKVRDDKIARLYWKSKTEISSWASENMGSSKVHTFVPSVPLCNIPRFERLYWKVAKAHSKIKPLGVGYYVIIRNLECTASARIMLDEKDNEAIRQYEEFVSELADQAVKLGGSVASTFGLGTILVGLAKKHTSPSWGNLSSKLRSVIDPRGIMSPDKKG